MAGVAATKAPPTFIDGLTDAMNSLSTSLGAPDADVTFASELIKIIGTYINMRHNPQGQNKQGQPGQPPGQPGQPGQASGQPPGQPSNPNGPSGNASANPNQPSMQAPTPPQPPGSNLNQGLSPNPDELRRVMQEVAGQ